MIPLESATAILPRMPTGRAMTGEFPLTIMKPPVLDVKARASPSSVSSPIYRLLRSRNQRRNSSASSARSCCSTKPECKEFVTERVEVFDLSELTPQLSGVDEDKRQPCDSTDLTEDSKPTDSPSTKETELQSENCLGLETKENKISQSENSNKRSRKKSCKAKRTNKKRKNSMKKSFFARFVGSHVQKKQQGQPVNSNEQVKPRANIPQVRDTSPNKYLNIQKLHTTYSPKKNDNKTKNAILLPRVSNANLTKDNTGSCTSSPRKQELELENALISPRTSSPRKLLNSDDDKVKKIFLSETHSGMVAGIPCAPPSTPTVDELKKVEYIPSLTDVKSQRAVKTRLVNLGNKMRAEEQRKKEKVLKEEQKKAYGAILQLKQRQRAEIYALNKVMTELENENFRKFMEENSAESLPV